MLVSPQHTFFNLRDTQCVCVCGLSRARKNLPLRRISLQLFKYRSCIYYIHIQSRIKIRAPRQPSSSSNSERKEALGQRFSHDFARARAQKGANIKCSYLRIISLFTQPTLIIHGINDFYQCVSPQQLAVYRDKICSRTFKRLCLYIVYV